MAMEKPRLVFAFGPTQDSYFIGCGTEMQWHKLPVELEEILLNHASTVLSISLGPHNAFYCRYLTRRSNTLCTASGNLPPNLSFLLSSWFADPHALPHVALGAGGSFFFQSSALAAWEGLPRRLEALLRELRESAHGAAIPARALALGCGGGFTFFTDGRNGGEIPVWDRVDGELAHRLGGVEDDVFVESACLSLATKDDYLIVFSDGSVFYSVPDALLPVVQAFVQIFHMALTEHDEYGLTRPRSPRQEMAAAMQEKGQCAFSLKLPDGILGWDGDAITRFVEDAVGGRGRRSPSASSSSERSWVGKKLRVRKEGYAGYAASWVENQRAFELQADYGGW